MGIWVIRTPILKPIRNCLIPRTRQIGDPESLKGPFTNFFRPLITLDQLISPEVGRLFPPWTLVVPCTLANAVIDAIPFFMDFETHLGRRIDAGGIQQLLNTSHSLEPRAVGVQVLVMTLLSILTIITFNILRPKNKIIYEPKVKYHATDKRPPRISDSFCGWMTPLLHNHEPDLLEKIGLDAAVFLRFLKLMRWLFTLTSIVVCGALIPVDFLYTISVKPPGYDFLTSMTIRDVKGVRLYAHVAAVYIITFFLIALVYHHWRGIYQLRNEWFRSPEYQRLFYARTLCITHIPERRQSDEGLYRIFVGMQLPYTVTSVHIGKNVGELPELIEKHNETVEELEQLFVKHLRDGKSTDERLTIKSGGCCGIGGREHDAIKIYMAKLKHTSAAVEQYRAQLDLRGPENFGFATIDSIPAAHAAARELRGKHPKGLTIKLAPNPKDIIWKNMGLSKPHRQFRRMTGFILLILFCFLSLIPLFPIASLANLNAIATSGYIPFLQRWANSSPVSYTLASGIVPPAIASIFGSFIPPLMRWLSKYMGATTHTSLDRIVIARYFTFQFISQLLFFTVIGVLFQSALEIIIAIQEQGAGLKLVLDNIDKLPKRLTSTYVDQSSFWLKWFPLTGFLIIFDLSQVYTLLWISWSSRIFGRTPREQRESTKPPIFLYAIHYSNLLFMGVVGLLFAPVAPLVSLAAAVVFWLCSWVYKYQLMFKYVTRVESGGRSWNVVINRLIFGCIFMQFVMVFTIGLQAQFRSLQFLTTLPPIPITLLFKHYINRRFANDFQYFTPTFTELPRSIVHSENSDISGNKLQDRYRNPALETELFNPLVNSKAISLLRRIYKGKNNRKSTDRTRGIGEKSVIEKSPGTDETVEGITFTPINEDEVDYDPMLYRRDREVIDRDFDSVNDTSTTDSHLDTTDSRIVHDHAHDVSTVTREHGHELYHLPAGPPPIISNSPYSGYPPTPRNVSPRRRDRLPSSLSVAAPSRQSSYNRVLGHESNAQRPQYGLSPHQLHPAHVHQMRHQLVDRGPVPRTQDSNSSHSRQVSVNTRHDSEGQATQQYRPPREQPTLLRGHTNETRARRQ